jgi:hypothetical protein
LFGFKDRDEAHRKLAEVLASGTHPRACCVEDPNDSEEPYQVHTDNPTSNAVTTVPSKDPEFLGGLEGLSAEDKDDIARRVVALLAKPTE